MSGHAALYQKECLDVTEEDSSEEEEVMVKDEV